MMPLEQARATLVEQFEAEGKTYPDVVLDAVFMSINENEVTQAAEVRVRWEWWDGESPVNGQSADDVKERIGDFDQAYVVYLDDRLTYFQPAEIVDPETFVAQLRADMIQASLLQFARTRLLQLDVQQAQREAATVVPPEEVAVTAAEAALAARRSRYLGRVRAASRGF